MDLHEDDYGSKVEEREREGYIYVIIHTYIYRQKQINTNKYT